jgi:hypothetical protein
MARGPSSVYLVERSRVSEAAVPYLVNNLGRGRFVRTIGPVLDRMYSSSSDAILLMVGECHDLVLKELVGPSALTA